MRVAVTGGAGFIGSHVVDRLIRAGHEPLVIDRHQPHREDVEGMVVDILDAPAIDAALAGCDAVMHLAAVANVNDAFEDPSEAVNLTVLGTARVLDAARRNALARFVLASTVWVYGAAPASAADPLDETTPFDLAGVGHVYTASKIAAELIVQSYAELYGQSFTILRYGVPFGPRMRPQLVIPRFVNMALADQPITINGDGSAFRRYVYVEDLAEANVLALAPEAAGKVINLEGDVPVTVRQIVDAVGDALGRSVRATYGAARPGDFEGREISGQAAADILGWRPTTSFEEGLRRYVEWLAP